MFLLRRMFRLRLNQPERLTRELQPTRNPRIWVAATEGNDSRQRIALWIGILTRFCEVTVRGGKYKEIVRLNSF